jgi:hypothetical protein
MYGTSERKEDKERLEMNIFFLSNGDALGGT